MRLLASLLFYLVVRVVLVSSQSCQIYDITNNAFCLVRTDYPVFVAAGSSQNALGSVLLKALNVSSGSYGQGSSNVEKIAGQFPPDCIASYTALICSLYIPGCNSSGSQVQPIASPVCLSSCTDVVRDCGPVISGLLNVNCSATAPGSNVPLYLNDSDTLQYSNGTGTWNLGCVRANQYPYCQVAVLTNVSAVAGFCKLKCMNLFWTADQVRTVRIIMYIIAWVSFFANLFVVLSYLLDPRKRAFPSILALFFSINFTCYGLIMAIHSIVGPNKILCKNESTPHTMSTNFLCGLGAAVSHFAIVSGAAWMLMLSLNLVYFMKFGKHLPRWSQIPMHVFAWGFPAILVSVALGKKKYAGGATHTVLCGIDHLSFFDGVLLIPYFTLYGISIVLASGVVFYIIKQTGRKGLWRQSQLLGFLVLLSVMEMLAIVLRIHQNHYTTKRWAPQFIHWTACEYAKYLGLVSSCSRPGRDGIAFAAFSSLVQLFGQLLVFIFFGLTRQNLQFWQRLLATRSWDTISTTASGTKSSGRGPSEEVSGAEDSKF